MAGNGVRGLGPVGFTFFWLGVAVVVVFVVGVVAGLLRDDLAGTLGPVVGFGMMASSVAIILALAVRQNAARQG